MKILIVSPYFYPKTGGLENYAFNIIKKLKEHHNITILCSSINKDSIESFKGMKIIRFKPSHILSNTPIRYNLIIKISEVLREGDFDIVNAHTPVPFYADMAAIASKKNNTPFVLTYHNDVIKDGLLKIFSSVYNKSLLQFTLRVAKRIITPSPYVYNESNIIRKFVDKTVWIPPGVDVNTYKPGRSDVKNRYNLPEDSKIILFVGAMNRGHNHKGVDILLKAFSTIKADNIHLILAGGGNMIPEYKKLAKSLGIDDKTTFTGFVDEKSLIELYRGSYMLVLPTTTAAEGFGMVITEANACGKPVIGSRIGGIKYVIKDGETGLLVPPNDPESLADAIIHLLENPPLARRMGEKGRKMVEQKYTWQKAAEATEKVFLEALQ